MKAKIARKRHVLKTITWRVIASGTTFLLAWLFFKDDSKAVEKATWVAITETGIKMLLYYFHERIWYNSDFGVTHNPSNLDENGAK